MFKKIILSLIFIIFFLFLGVKDVKAQGVVCPFVTEPNLLMGGNFNRLTLRFTLTSEANQEIAKYPNIGKLQFSFPKVGIRPNTCGEIDASLSGNISEITRVKSGVNIDPCTNYLFAAGIKRVQLVYDVQGTKFIICRPTDFWVFTEQSTCTASVRYEGSGDVNSRWFLTLTDVMFVNPYNHFRIKIDENVPYWMYYDNINKPGSAEGEIPRQYITSGQHIIRVYSTIDSTSPLGPLMCQYGPFTIGARNTPAPSLPPPNSGITPLPYNPPNATDICNSVDHDSNDPALLDLQAKPYQDCVKCVRDTKGIWTALGCIKTDIAGFVSSFFTIGLGLAGGIALLFLIYGGFLILTSGGNLETIQHGREILTSAIAGLLLIIFSVFIIQLVAVDILKIPGFERGNSDGSAPAAPTPTNTPIPPTITSTPTQGPTNTPGPTASPTPTPTLPPPSSQGLSIYLPGANPADPVPKFNPNEIISVEISGFKSFAWNTLVIVTNKDGQKTDCEILSAPQRTTSVTTPNTPSQTAAILVLASYKTCSDVSKLNDSNATIQATKAIYLKP